MLWASTWPERSEEHWREIEKAYGKPISEEGRGAGTVGTKTMKGAGKVTAENQSGSYQGGYQNNGGNFFSRLFGGGFGDAQPAQRRRAAQGRQSWGFQ